MVAKAETDEEVFVKLIDFLRCAQSDQDIEGIMTAAQTFVAKIPTLRNLLNGRPAMFKQYAALTRFASMQSVTLPLAFFNHASPILWDYMHPVLDYSFLVLRFLLDDTISLHPQTFENFWPLTDTYTTSRSLRKYEESPYLRTCETVTNTYRQHKWNPSGNTLEFLNRFILECAEPAFLLVFGTVGLKNWGSSYFSSTLTSGEDDDEKLQYRYGPKQLIVPDYVLWDVLYTEYLDTLIRLTESLKVSWGDLGKPVVAADIILRLVFLAHHSPFHATISLSLIATPIFCPSFFAAVKSEFGGLSNGLMAIGHYLTLGLPILWGKRDKSRQDASLAPLVQLKDAVTHPLAYYYNNSLANWSKGQSQAPQMQTDMQFNKIVGVVLNFRHTLSTYREELGAAFTLNDPPRHPFYANDPIYNARLTDFKAFMSMLRKTTKPVAAKAHGKAINQLSPCIERFVDLKDAEVSQAMRKLDKPTQELIKLFPLMAFNYLHPTNSNSSDAKLFELTGLIHHMERVWRPLFAHQSLAHFLQQLHRQAGLHQENYGFFEFWPGLILAGQAIPDKNSAEDEDGNESGDDDEMLWKQGMREETLARAVKELTRLKKFVLKPENGAAIKVKRANNSPWVMDPELGDSFDKMATLLTTRIHHTSSVAIGLEDEDEIHPDDIGYTLDQGNVATDKEMEAYKRLEQQAVKELGDKGKEKSMQTSKQIAADWANKLVVGEKGKKVVKEPKTVKVAKAKKATKRRGSSMDAESSTKAKKQKQK